MAAVTDYMRERDFNEDGSPKRQPEPEKTGTVDFAKNSGKNAAQAAPPVASKASVEFTRENIADKVDVTGLSTPALDAINTHMFAAMQKYGLEKLPDFAPTNLQRAILGVDRVSGNFVFNAASWNEIVRDPRAAFVRFVKEPEKRDGRKRFSVVKERQLVKYMVDHEVGHRIFNRSQLPDKEKRIEALWLLHRDDETFGSYAASEPREFFSEAFAIRERGGILSNDVLDFINEVIK